MLVFYDNFNEHFIRAHQFISLNFPTKNGCNLRTFYTTSILTLVTLQALLVNNMGAHLETITCTWYIDILTIQNLSYHQTTTLPFSTVHQLDIHYTKSANNVLLWGLNCIG